MEFWEHTFEKLILCHCLFTCPCCVLKLCIIAPASTTRSYRPFIQGLVPSFTLSSHFFPPRAFWRREKCLAEVYGFSVACSRKQLWSIAFWAGSRGCLGPLVSLANGWATGDRDKLQILTMKWHAIFFSLLGLWGFFILFFPLDFSFSFLGLRVESLWIKSQSLGWKSCWRRTKSFFLLGAWCSMFSLHPLLWRDFHSQEYRHLHTAGMESSILRHFVQMAVFLCEFL